MFIFHHTPPATRDYLVLQNLPIYLGQCVQLIWLCDREQIRGAKNIISSSRDVTLPQKRITRYALPGNARGISILIYKRYYILSTDIDIEFDIGKSWGPFLESPEKLFLKLLSAYYKKLFQDKKGEICCKMYAWKRMRFEDT